MSFKNKALNFHSSGRKGKLEVVATKPCDTEMDLSLAYSPGVAYPCTEIQNDPSKVFEYTSRGNLIAVISDGSAVLGLGNIGPLAGKPVMEGKSILFKRFADIDVFDIELNVKSVDEFVSVVKSLEPTFGGINLEDIKAPECFEIEERLKKELNIPVFHDDQHGTAIISGAGLINAAEIANKKLKDLKIVFNGAGAAGVACANIFISLGAKKDNIIMCDSKGPITDKREGLNSYKKQFITNKKITTLKQALKGADVFIGLSVGGAVTKDMIKQMNNTPIVFAMANPTPEIMPDEVKAVTSDAIIATGRSDLPNQVNNLLGFPYIFRGALDARATSITQEMKLAAVNALAELAKEEVPESVSIAYGGKSFKFGPDYLIPKPFDPRVLLRVSTAVAKAAETSGVAKIPIKNYEAYKQKLESLQGASKGFIREAINRIKKRAKNSKLPKIIFPEGHSEKILKAVNIIVEEKIAEPFLLGYKEFILNKAKELNLDSLKDVHIERPNMHEKYDSYVKQLYKLRHRKGVHMEEALRLMKDPNYFASMSTALGDSDAMITGAAQNYADSVRPILEIIGTTKKGVAAGLIIMIINQKVYLFADVTLNVNPSANELSHIAAHAADVARYFHIEPNVAMLSFSNFSSQHDNPKKMKEAVELVRKHYPEIKVDGEMQADTALNPEIISELFPFSSIKNGANILIFPNLDAGNIAYKMVQQLGKGEVLGPFLMGVRRPANVLQRTCGVNDIVNTVALTAVQVQERKSRNKI